MYWLLILSFIFLVLGIGGAIILAHFICKAMNKKLASLEGIFTIKKGSGRMWDNTKPTPGQLDRIVAYIKDMDAEGEGIMKEIIEDLKKIITKIESWDDPTGPELGREQIGKAHYIIEECICKIEEI